MSARHLGFFGLQNRARRRTVWLLSASFVLLWFVANLIAIPSHVREECTYVGYTRCESQFFVNGGTLVITALVVAAYLGIAYLASGRAALSLAGAHAAEGPEYQTLRNIVDEMSIAAGVPRPHVYVIDDPSPNAFATGRNPEHAAVTVTTGLLSAMDRSELTGVVAHEVAHIKNRDIAVTTLAVLTAGVIAILADVSLRIGMVIASSGRSRSSKESGGVAAFGFALIALGFVLYVIALPAALILRAALSRQRESLADASAVQYTRDPSGLRSALEKLLSDTSVPTRVSVATAHLWIDHPKPVSGAQRGILSGLLDTHPPLEQRIAVLREMEGIPPDVSL
jgi:heat shock protein HtpX